MNGAKAYRLARFFLWPKGYGPNWNPMALCVWALVACFWWLPAESRAPVALRACAQALLVLGFVIIVDRRR